MASFEQPLAIGRIGPGPGDDAGAVARADLLLVGLDQEIERGRIDVAFFGQHRFQRAHAQLGFRQFGMVVIVVVMMVVVVVVMVVHKGRIVAKSGLCRGERLC